MSAWVFLAMVAVLVGSVVGIVAVCTALEEPAGVPGHRAVDRAVDRAHPAVEADDDLLPARASGTLRPTVDRVAALERERPTVEAELSSRPR